jgi:hypothetical protein
MILTLLFVYSFDGYKVKGGRCLDFIRGVDSRIPACVSFGISRKKGLNEIKIKPGLDSNYKLFENGWKVGVYKEFDSSVSALPDYIPEGYHKSWNDEVRDKKTIAKIVGLCMDNFWGAFELLTHVRITEVIKTIAVKVRPNRINSNFNGDEHDFSGVYPQDCGHGSREGIILRVDDAASTDIVYDYIWEQMRTLFIEFSKCTTSADQYKFLYNNLVNSTALNFDALYKLVTNGDPPPPRTKEAYEKWIKTKGKHRMFKTKQKYHHFVIIRLLRGDGGDLPW